MTERVIGCAYRVGNTLGVGFLEKVYENALALELRGAGVTLHQLLINFGASKVEVKRVVSGS